MIALSCINRRLVDSTCPFSHHASQGRKPLQPVGGLQHNFHCRLDELFIGGSASANTRLIGKCPYRFESALNCHEPEFSSKIVRVKSAQALQPSLFQKKQ